MDGIGEKIERTKAAAIRSSLSFYATSTGPSEYILTVSLNHSEW